MADAFEDLCRQWVLTQAQAGQLPFLPDFIGSDWASDYQADVVAVNWRERAVLIGEAKWADDDLQRATFRDLQQRADQVIARLSAAEPSAKRRGPDAWKTHLMLFGRKGASVATRQAAQTIQARVVSFAEIRTGLGIWASA